MSEGLRNLATDQTFSICTPHTVTLPVNAKCCGPGPRKRHAVNVSVMHALDSKQNDPLLLPCSGSSVHYQFYYLGQLGGPPLLPGSVHSVQPPSYVLFRSLRLAPINIMSPYQITSRYYISMYNVTMATR